MLLRFKRQQRKDMIDITEHRARAPLPPRPHRGRYIVDDRDRTIPRPHPSCHPMGEIGTVDDHENIGRGVRRGGGGRTDQPQDLPELRYYRRHADDRQIRDTQTPTPPLPPPPLPPAPPPTPPTS